LKVFILEALISGTLDKEEEFGAVERSNPGCDQFDSRLHHLPRASSHLAISTMILKPSSAAAECMDIELQVLITFTLAVKSNGTEEHQIAAIERAITLALTTPIRSQTMPHRE